MQTTELLSRPNTLPADLRGRDDTKPISFRRWREGDPPATTVGELSHNDFDHRVVIRTKEFLGTIYGTLVGIHPHQALVHFTCVQLHGRKELVIRNDMEVLVLDF